LATPVECSICQSHSFTSIGTGTAAKCTECGSLERTRFLWSYLGNAKLLSPQLKLLHVAPEKALLPKLRDLIGDGYQPADFNPARYSIPEVKVAPIDLSDISAIPNESFDIVMHLHVLEHIPVPLEGVMFETMRILRPNGRFIFGLPIGPGISFENIWPDTTPEERHALFGQHDHVRLVGRADFPRFLARVFAPFSKKTDFRIDPSRYLDEKQFFDVTGLSFKRVMDYTGDTIFEVIKAPQV